MGGSFDVILKFPARFLTPELEEFIQEEYHFDEVDEILEWEQEHMPVSRRMVRLEIDGTNNGELPNIEHYLEQNNIPFDLYCSAGDGYPAEDKYVRPDQGITRKVIVAGTQEYISSESIEMKELLSDSRLMTMTKEEIVKFLLSVRDNYTSYDVNPIQDYTSETDIGKDQNKMNEIDAVLARLDKGEITQADAMEEIKNISEREKPDETK